MGYHPPIDRQSILLEGYNPRKRDSACKTMLHIAAEGHEVIIISKLLEMGDGYAMARVEDTDGKLPLHYASQTGT